MKILMLVDNLNIGGTETYIFSTSKSLIDLGHEVIVGTQKGELANFFKENSIETIFINFVEKELINLIKKYEINIIHCHLNKSMDICSRISDKVKIPYIITLHGLFYSSTELNNTCLKASHIIVVSLPVKNMLLNCMNEDIEYKVTIIYNTFDLALYKKFTKFIDIRKNLNIKANEKIIVYCSRLSYSKGRLAEQFIHAFYELAKELDNIQAIIIGDGPKKAHLDFYKNSFNTKLNRDCIHVIGATTNVIPYYLESSFVVGSARVAIEAMNCCKPIIALGSKSFEGLVTKNNSKSIIESYFGDHSAINAKNISDLIATMRFLIEDEEQCLEIGSWSREWCHENFNNNKSINILHGIYITQCNL